MLVGIAINAACFGPEVVVDQATRRGAERVLDASLSRNALLLGIRGEDFLDDVVASASRIDSPLGQQIQMLAVESRKSKVDSFTGKASMLAPGSSAVDRLRRIAVETSPHVVVCASSDQARQLRHLNPRIERCLLADFPRTEAEARRDAWNAAQRLDTLEPVECEQLIGSAIRYGDELVVADRVIGLAAKDGYVTSKLKRFARGITYLAERWCEYAPMLGTRRACVKVVTQAGASGARGGWIDPTAAREAIEKGVRREDAKSAIGSLQIVLKEETNPPIFRDRLLASDRRVWGIRHGFDDISNLAGSAARRSPTFFDPDSTANRELLREILTLPDAG